MTSRSDAQSLTRPAPFSAYTSSCAGSIHDYLTKVSILNQPTPVCSQLLTREHLRNRCEAERIKMTNKNSTDCVGDSPLKALRVRELLKKLSQGRSLNARGHLERRYTFKSFAQALAFANKVGADAEGHHPDLYLTYGKCEIEIWSHKMKGLTERDFIVAAKANQEFIPFRAPV
jgi:4a-hydroxytetrahydrobiopterin dehydratase